MIDSGDSATTSARGISAGSIAVKVTSNGRMPGVGAPEDIGHPCFRRRGEANLAAGLLLPNRTAAVGVLPENDQSTLRWLFAVCGAAAFALLTGATSASRRSAPSYQPSPSTREQSS
ncbi:hypothetical protein GCM10023114_45250 [Mycolicibacterium sediminis]